MKWSRLYLTLDFKYLIDLFTCSFAPGRSKNIFSGKYTDI